MERGERRFGVRYSSWLLPLFLILLLGPRRAFVRVTDREVRVRMGWAFDATIPRANLRNVARQPDWWLAIGVHTNFRGSWLVNGSSTGIVGFQVEPPVRATSAGFGGNVSRLSIALEEPEAFIAALRSEP